LVVSLSGLSIAIKMRKVIIAISILLSISATAQMPESIIQWLAANNGRLSARINQYNKEQYNLLINQNKFALTNDKQLVHFQESTWEVNTKATVVADKKDAVDYSITFHCI